MNLWLLLLSQLSFSLSQNHVYHFINDECKSWCEARTFCRKYYTDLATVNDMTDLERLKLKHAADGRADAWIGLHNGGGDREWHWSQPGVEFSESEATKGWANSEPNDSDGQENCVVVRSNSKWNDLDCNADRCFICYNGSSGSKFVNTPKKWTVAQNYCRERHADLISGLDRIKTTVLPKDENCERWGWWIGLSRDTWVWSDQSNSSFRNWDQKDPHLNKGYHHDDKNCVKLGHQGQWIRDDCTNTHNFICYDERFILVREKKTWEEALIHCRRHHLDLAWHNGPHQGRMVQERAKMADSKVVWLGLHFTCFFEEWIWVNGHYVPHDDENWKDHRNNKCEVSGAMERGGRNKWVKRPSEEKHNFICVRNIEPIHLMQYPCDDAIL